MPARKAARLNLLTVREVQHASDGDHSDGGGLLLRVRGTFSSWVYRFTAPSGRRREMGLGAALRGSAKQAGDTLTGARELAHKAREALRQGIDPIEARERQRECVVEAEQARKAAKARERWTLARSARDFHERVIEPTRTPKHAAQWISSLENHMPAAVWHAPLDAIDAPALLGVLTAIRPHQRARNLPQGERVAETVQRIRQRLDAVFEDAVFHGRVHQNPAAAIRRKLREATPRREKGSFAALPYREAPALLGRVRAMPGTAARCLELAVLCAARTNEVLGAEWSEFDLEAAIWVVPASRMKGGADHVVHLPSRALELLRLQSAQDSRLVFPSPMSMTLAQGQRKPLSNMALLTVLQRLGVCNQTTVHGLCRATFSTWANETGAARPDVIEACLAHEESNRVRAAYNRAQFAEERRSLLAAWAEYLQREPALVVPLRAA